MERPITRIPAAEGTPEIETTDDLDAALGPTDQVVLHEPSSD